MTPVRWQKIYELFQAAVTRPANERSAFLNESCAADTALRREVAALLAADSEVDDFAQIARGVAAEWAGGNDHPDLVGQTFGRLFEKVTPAGFHCGKLKLDSMWDPLRGDPRFEAIVASHAPRGAK